jgi:subtilisin-like proprotein convertase family protein
MKNPSRFFRRRFIINAALIFIFLPLLISFPALVPRTETTISRARNVGVSGVGDSNSAPSAVRLSESFDSVTAPALPAGWTTSASGSNLPFATTSEMPYTAPNAIFTNNPATAGIAEITSPAVSLGNARATLTFRHSYETEFRTGFDGGVLEISVNGGAFQDILEAGASFAGGGYIQPISGNATGNPLIGRQVWTGDSEGYKSTIVHLPLGMANQTVRFRWRFATDNSFEGMGWRIDSVRLEDYVPTILTFAENFDSVSQPQIPAGWTTEETDPGRAFRTNTEYKYTAPNSAFAPAPASAGTAAIISPSIRIGSNSPKLIFQHHYAADAGRKGGVLEISINGGAFQDIVTAGGSFAHGGYTGVISGTTGNPLANRQAWTGSVTGFMVTEVNLPPSAYRQNVRFKWLFATDNFILSIGWWIDAVQVTEAIAGENLNAISIPAAGIAEPYPTEIQVANQVGLITSVQVNLVNFSHTAPDDVDLLLVSPSGRKVVLMSDVGGANAVSNISLSIEDSAAASLPDNAPLAPGSYKPANFEPADNFPAPAPSGAPTGNKLSVLNGSEPNGVWKLFLVDDSGNNAGSISGGWNLSLQTSPDVITIPESGAAQPFPSEFNVSGLPGSLSKVTVNLSNFSHTAPDDADIMLVAPNGRRIVLMSDVGGSAEVGGLNITIDDNAASTLPDNAPLASGAYKPTDFEPGDQFPAPAPQGVSGTTLNNFFGISPNGVWKLYVVDDTGENSGSIAGNWSLDIQSSVGVCQFSLSSGVQAFPMTGGSGDFGVQIPAGCPWTAASNNGFINVSSGSSGEGAGIIRFTVAPNAGAFRTGTITVTNGSFARTFQVQQASGCPFAVNQSTMSFSSAGGTGNIQVSAGAECSWQTSANAPWIFVTSAPQSGNGTASFTVQPNPSANSRSASITIGAQIVTVNQAGAAGKLFDFDGDGRSDISVFRQQSGSWYLLQSTAGFSGTQFGIASDKLAPADYDGDRKTDIAVFREGNWYILQSSNSAFRSLQFGLAGDKPLPSDYNGDGRAELAVYRSGQWYTLDLTSNQSTGVQFGNSTDKPVAADYDGDGRTDPAVYRDGVWYLLRSTQGFTSVQFGISTDKPIVGDFDGDGKTDQAVYRASTGSWYINRSLDGQFTGIQFGVSSDIPAAADYDGDAKTDIAVFRAGNWYILSSQNGAFTATQFGLSDDLPVPAAFVP